MALVGAEALLAQGVFREPFFQKCMYNTLRKTLKL